MTDVIVSPAKAFQSIVERPSWLAPAILLFVVAVVALAVFTTRADWVAIDTALLERYLKMLPDAQRDQAIAQGTAAVRRFTTGQLVIQKTLERAAGIPLFLLGMAVVYATLFVFMGAFPKMKLGSAWLAFLIAMLMFGGYLFLSVIATQVYPEAPSTMLLITGTAAIVMVAGWVWVIQRQAAKDVEFHRVLAVCSHAMVITTIGYLALLLSVFVAAPPITVAPEEFVKSNLGAVMDTGSPALQSLLGSLDLFMIWFMVVLTIGFRVVTRLSMGLAASITWLPWAVITLVKMAFRAIFT